MRPKRTSTDLPFKSNKDLRDKLTNAIAKHFGNGKEFLPTEILAKLTRTRYTLTEVFNELYLMYLDQEIDRTDLKMEGDRLGGYTVKRKS